MKQTFTFLGFINFALSLEDRGDLIDLKHKFKGCIFYFGFLDISFNYFSDIQINRISGEDCLQFIKENELIIEITRDKFEYKRLKKEWDTWKTIKEVERKQHETIDDFLKNCEILIKQALIDYVCHK